jgi:hypothetical protein
MLLIFVKLLQTLFFLTARQDNGYQAYRSKNVAPPNLCHTFIVLDDGAKIRKRSEK